MFEQNNDSFWMDEYLACQQEKKQNNHLLNIKIDLIKQQKIFKNKQNKKIFLPFVERFKDKCWAFNKNGQIQKIYQLNQPKNLKINFNNKNKIYIKTENQQPKIINQLKLTRLIKKKPETSTSSRNAKSLGSSQVSQAQNKSKNHRYKGQFSAIQQQQFQQTAVKASTKTKRIFTSAGSRHHININEVKRSKMFDQERQSGSSQNVEKGTVRPCSIGQVEKEKQFRSQKLRSLKKNTIILKQNSSPANKMSFFPKIAQKTPLLTLR